MGHTTVVNINRVVVANCFPRLLNLDIVYCTSSPPFQDFQTLPLQSSEKTALLSDYQLPHVEYS